MNLPINGKYSKTKKYASQKAKYFDKPVKEIKFVHDYSVKSDGLKFTNFFERKTSKRNIVIKQVINNCINDYTFFKKYFEGREVSQKTSADVKKRERLHKIIALYGGIQIDDNKLFKYVPNKLYNLEYGKERGLQFVFEHKNEIIYVYLIDLYHLAIPSKTNEKGERFALFDEYNRRSLFSKDMQEVIFEKEKIPN